MARKILNWLACDPYWGPMLRMSRSCITAKSVINNVLPHSLSKNIEVTKIEKNILTLTVPGSPFAAKLRQLIPTLLTALSITEIKLTSVKIKIQCKKVRKTGPVINQDQKESIYLGKEALKSFRALHKNLESGNPISEAIEKLLRNHGPSNGFHS